MSEEVEEFVESLEHVPDSREKDEVVEHLTQTRTVIAAQLMGDADDEGRNAAVTLLTFFVENAGGLMQADGEGSTRASV